jgi:protein-S-isoprenylcysteine O-methyltransferase Ste14
MDGKLFLQAIGKFLAGLLLVGLLLYIPIIAARIKNEEEVLKKGLEGYEDYCRRVRYKVIPRVW